MDAIQDVTLSVPAISCNHCVQNIDKALSALTGIETVTSDVLMKTVHLRYNAELVSMQFIKDVLSKAGYPVVTGSVQTPRRSGKPLRLA